MEKNTEKKPLTAQKLELLALIEEKVFYANWVKMQVYLDATTPLRWLDFYDLLKEKFVKINQVEDKWITSYVITELGIAELFKF